jgi:hypothetical protein
MGLAAIQSALAQLYTSADSREELRSNVQQFAVRHGLSASEVEGLAASVLDEAEVFARALARKRFSEAAKAMPNAQACLGPKLDEHFARFAAVTPLGAQRNPAFDALEFIRWLLREQRGVLSASDVHVLRYEDARILMQQSSRRFLVRWLKVPNRGTASRSLVIWWRWRGRLRCWVND